MNGNIFYLIPGIVCIVWLFIFMFLKRNDTQKMALRILCVAAVYFTLYMVIFSSGFDYSYVCMADMVILPLILTLLASLVIFVNAHMKEKKFSSYKLQWLYAPALLEGSIVSVLYYLLGIDKVAALFMARESVPGNISVRLLFESLPREFDTELFRIFYLFDVIVFNILIILMSLAVVIMCFMAVRRGGYRFGDTFRFIFRGAETNPLRITAFLVTMLLVTVMPLSLFGRTYIIQNTWIGCTISILVSFEILLLCHCEAISDRQSFTLYEMMHVSNELCYVQDNRNAEEPVVTHQLVSARALEKKNLIIENLKTAFDEDKVWLNAELRLSTLAEDLKTSRNNLSVIFNQVYGKDFKSLVAERRIEEAKSIMEAEPSATIDYVAIRSGFRESTVFFHRFKDIVGITPTEWKNANIKIV